MTSGTEKTSPAVDPEETARWEQRTVNRVLESGDAQLLERSRLIVDAAYDLLRDEGLDGLTIRAVLKKTGLARRAFYERFAGKDDLMLAVFEHTIRRASKQYSEMIASMPDPLERVELIVTSMVPGARESSDEQQAADRRSAAMSREHVRLAESRPEELQESLRPLVGLIARQLADGMEQGVVRKTDPLMLATLLYNMVSTTAHTEFLTQEATGPDFEHRRELASQLWEFCRRAIAAP